MSGQNPEYWPFAFPEPEKRTELHRELLHFLEESYHENFRPCKFMDGEYRVETRSGRSGWLLYRGRFGKTSQTRWEVWLNDQQTRILSFWVDDFRWASTVVLLWLRGADATDVLAAAGEHVIRGPSLTQPAAIDAQ